MESKKINQLATSVSPQTSDLTIIGDPITGVSKKITLLQIANLFATTGTVSSVAVTETGDALTITGSPITSAGTINIGFAGDATQYVRGDGALADFPTSTGGGSSVSYYLNSSVSQGTIGGVAYKELSKDPIAGAGTDITISADGYIASYITDANDPALLEVPGGNFNCEFYFSVNSNAHNPYVYAELYKYDGSTFTLLGSSQSVPEYLSNGTTLSPYYFAIPVAVAALNVTDRLAIRIYVNVDGRVVTLHTENNHLCQIVTTFSKGLISLNNLTRQNQFFGTGTSGTDFAITSSTATHTFNLPVASAANTGKLSSTDWSTFNNKQAALTFTAPLVNTSNTISIPVATTSINGYLASADFTTFNNKQNAITLTTTGTSGAATLVGATLNIPQYADQFVGTVTSVGLSSATSGVTIGSSPITTSGTITLAIATASGSQNGLLSSTDWTTFNSKGSGSVTSVAALTIGTSGTDLSSTVANSTTTPVITLNVPTASAANRGALASADWTTFNNKQGTITLTTTGTSGAATFSSNTLNIPNYGSALSAYLPLAGGTLTGALSGTSATFSSTLNVTSAYTTLYGLRLSGNDTDNTIYQATGALGISTGGGSIAFKPNLTTALTLASTGAATFSSSVTGQQGVNVGTNALGTDRMFQISGTAFTSGATQFGIVNNPTMTTPTTIYGYYGGVTVTSATNGYGLYIVSAAGTITNKFGIYQEGTNDKNYFAGNVGIGTSSPDTLLHLAATQGTLKITSNSTSGANAPYLSFFHAGNDEFQIVGGGYLAFLSSGTTERMRITSGGNVGIGTSSPARNLVVQSSSTISLISIVSNPANIAYLLLGDTDADAQGRVQYDNGSDSLQLYSNGTERMRITSGGNVLIGTTTDESYKLYVNGGSGNAGLFNSTSAANQIKASGTAPAITFTNTITSPTIGGTLGAATSANHFLTGTSAGDLVLINNYSGNRVYVVSSSGGVYLTSGATSWTANSDIRLKNINSHIEKAVEKLSTLQTINFSYKDDKSNKQNLGLIAQEVEKIFPELVDKNGDDMLGVRYTELVPVLIKAIQELEARIKQIENK